MADAEAIAEAAARADMRAVAVKNEAQQARAMLFRTRDRLVGQRTQLINALRGHLAEFGLIAPRGPAQLKRLSDALETEGASLPISVHRLAEMHLEQIGARISALDGELRAAARASAEAMRLQTMPGVGPVTAMAIEAFALEMSAFRNGHGFAAWLGLVPKQRSTGGKQRLGKASKMGQRDIRRLLITGAMTVVRWAVRKGEARDPWLNALLG